MVNIRTVNAAMLCMEAAQKAGLVAISAAADVGNAHKELSELADLLKAGATISVNIPGAHAPQTAEEPEAAENK
jgi:hypothetical protein